MILLKTPSQLNRLIYVNKLTKEFFDLCKDSIRSGIATLEIEEWLIKFCEKNKVTSAFLNYRKFPHYLCISINNQIIHGFPSEYILKDGDLVTLDVGLVKDGYVSDNAETYIIGGETNIKYVECAYTALENAINVAKNGNRVYDISNVISNITKEFNLTTLRGFGGHGVGLDLHEKPSIPNERSIGVNWRLRVGMVIAIEPIIIDPLAIYKYESNGWTLSSTNGSLSAHVERSVAILQDKSIILMEV